MYDGYCMMGMAPLGGAGKGQAIFRKHQLWEPWLPCNPLLHFRHESLEGW